MKFLIRSRYFWWSPLDSAQDSACLFILRDQSGHWKGWNINFESGTLKWWESAGFKSQSSLLLFADLEFLARNFIVWFISFVVSFDLIIVFANSPINAQRWIVLKDVLHACSWCVRGWYPTNPKAVKENVHFILLMFNWKVHPTVSIYKLWSSISCSS